MTEKSAEVAVMHAHRRKWKGCPGGPGPPETLVKGTCPYLPYDHDSILYHAQFTMNYILVNALAENVASIVNWCMAWCYP